MLYHNTYLQKELLSFLKVRTKLLAIKTVASLAIFFSPSSSLSSNATLSDEGTWSKYYKYRTILNKMDSYKYV